MRVTRREAVQLVTATAVLGGCTPAPARTEGDMKMRITCFIRYQIDPFQRQAFREYAARWSTIIPRCGGRLIGYFLPDEGTNDIAWGLIAFSSLGAYEAYRLRLRDDPGARENFAFAQERKLVVREERTFLENVQGTIGATAPLDREGFPPSP